MTAGHLSPATTSSRHSAATRRAGPRSTVPPCVNHVSTSRSTDMFLSLPLSLSLSLIPGRGGGHRPNPFQVAPEASLIGFEGVSWPGVPPGVIVGRTLEHQMLDRLVDAVAVWADGRVPAPDTVKVSCYQWGMTSAYLCQPARPLTLPVASSKQMADTSVQSSTRICVHSFL